MTGISITLYFHLLLTCFPLHYNTPLLLPLYPPTAFHLFLSLCHPSCSHSGSPVTPAVPLHMTHRRFLSSLLCSPLSPPPPPPPLPLSSLPPPPPCAPPPLLTLQPLLVYRGKVVLTSRLEGSRLGSTVAWKSCKFFLCVRAYSLCVKVQESKRQADAEMNTWRTEKKRKLNFIHADLIWRLDNMAWKGGERSAALSFTVPLFTYVSWSNDALACVCSTLILIQFGWNGSFRQLSAARAPHGFLASSAGMRD